MKIIQFYNQSYWPDPGRTNIGVAVLELLETAKVVFTADVETRNKEIPKLMRKRKAHRMSSRRGEREVEDI